MTQRPIDADDASGLVAVIPAGGVGSRLWPLSRPDRPKFLLDLLGTGATLLQDTVARLDGVADQVYIVTGQQHAAAVHEQVPSVPVQAVLTEPAPRDSMAAIAFAAAVIEHRHGPQVMGSFAADHVIRELEAFAAAVETACAVAATGAVTVIGLDPTGPSSAYGYIKRGEAHAKIDGAFQVERFTEKPDPETAAQMLAEGGYAWNAGMYVMRTDVLLAHLARLQPAMHEGVRELATAWGTADWETVAERVWPSLTRISIDHAIAEPVAATGGVAVVPAAFDWHDIGDFDSLVALVGGGSSDVTSIGHTAHIDTEAARSVAVIGGATPVAIVGIDDVVVVQAEDAILVVARDAAQHVKQVADRWGTTSRTTS